MTPRVSDLKPDSRLQLKWLARFEELLDIAARRGRLTGLTRQQSDWLRQQRLAYREGRLLPQREELLRQIPDLLDGDYRRQVARFVHDAQAWVDHTGKDLSQLQARDTVTIDGRVCNIGKKAVYYRRRYTGLETGYRLQDDEIHEIEQLPGWSWTGPRARHE